MPTKNPHAHQPLSIIKTTYNSLPVPIPDSFLSNDPADPSQAQLNISYHKIDFATTPLPEYAGLYAVVLDGVLTPAECRTLLLLAQASAGGPSSSPPPSSSPRTSDGWGPALVNAGAAGEFLAPGYRNSDRIVWDLGTVVERILRRCFRARGEGDGEEEGVLERDLGVIEGERGVSVLGRKAVELGHRWRFTRGNERMRFLRYGKGQFFREHYDGTYSTPNGRERTFYTLHLYLNDSVATSSDASSDAQSPSASSSPAGTTASAQWPELLIKGGATTFYSADSARRLDVAPKAGRVLIFQHRGLYHAGDDVLEGVKYTMRTDLLYEFDETSGKLSGGRGLY